MEYKLQFSKASLNDIRNLPASILPDFLNQINKLEEDVSLEEPIYDKNGKIKSGYFKIYLNDDKHKIVYSKNKNVIKIEQVETIVDPFDEMIAINERNNELIYKIANNK